MSELLDPAPVGRQVVKRPGDFRRRGEDGPPVVPSADRTRQPKGNKPELVAKAERRGINPAGMTVDQLKAALGPEPADETYGRPSGFGDALEGNSSYALRKWIERGIAHGVIRLVIDGLDPNSVNLDDAGELDALVQRAQDAADSMIWADRGTFVHKLIQLDHEQPDTWGIDGDVIAEGEALGIPEALQRRILDEWRAFVKRAGITIHRSEFPIINDDLRIAGTADLLITFDHDIEAFDTVLLAGDAAIGDVKTGDPRDKYAVQMYGYASGQPFDTDTEQRGEW